MNITEKVSVSDLDLYDLRVLVRVDFNCPIDNDGKVNDDNRIRETLPTLKLIREKGAKCVVLLSHLGRPKGRDATLSLYPIALCLSKLMNEQITFIDDCVGNCVEKAINAASGGRIILLENVRYYEQEENTEDPVPETVIEFREMLTRLGDVYVNDAFGCAHRAHSSIVGVGMATKASGLLMKKELDIFTKIMSAPEAPFLAIIGGAKVHDKIKLIENLLDKVNVMIIGGGMAFTFLKVLYEIEIGQSLFDEEGVEDVKAIMQKADQQEVAIHLPLDFIIANRMDPDAETKICTKEEGIPKDWMGLDIGQGSIDAFKQVIAQAKTVIWNGPMGVFEWEKFDKGTKSLLEAIAERTVDGAITLLGGGDTSAAAMKWELSNRVTHVSTGGGATLELLEGKLLPGVSVLTDKSEIVSKQTDPVQGASNEPLSRASQNARSSLKRSIQEDPVDPDPDKEPAVEQVEGEVNSGLKSVDRKSTRESSLQRKTSIGQEDASRKSAVQKESLRKSAVQEEPPRKSATQGDPLRTSAAQEESLRKSAAQEEMLRKSVTQKEPPRKSATQGDSLRKSAVKEERAAVEKGAEINKEDESMPNASMDPKESVAVSEGKQSIKRNSVGEGSLKADDLNISEKPSLRQEAENVEQNAEDEEDDEKEGGKYSKKKKDKVKK
ncbi:hypothetical protein GJ496_007205 [Pomphorhynchus laevis]|nr:hypothetical protein GJ496_007205 [Pomphorhynchus laevis]